MFDPSRVAIVDQVDSSILIRGNMPLIQGRFAYGEISQALNINLNKYDKFLSLSLIDNTGERNLWSQEFNAFGVDPNLFPAQNWPPYLHIQDWNPGLELGTTLNSKINGSLIWWPIEGLPINTDSAAFLKSPGWDLTGLVERVTQLIKTPKLAVYFHCMLGADRTGALHASYLVKNKGMSATQALDVTSKATAAGAPTMDYQRLATAYSQK